MNRFQRMFFRRREREISAGELFDGMTSERAFALLNGLRPEQRKLPLMLVQRLIDGRQRSLVFGREMRPEEMYAMRGEMQALGEFQQKWQAWLEQADVAVEDPTQEES